MGQRSLYCLFIWTIFVVRNPFVVTGCSGDVCQCKQGGCEYVSALSTCADGYEACQNAFNPSDPAPHVCLRQGVWYSSGGLLCLMNTNLGDPDAECQIEETIMAVNLGGDEMEGGRGISYAADRDVPRYIRAEKRNYEKNTAATRTVYNPADGDEQLYKTVVLGAGKKRCDTYKVPGGVEGPYELSLKLKEGCWKTPGARYFTVRLAGMDVFPEIDILAYANEQYNPEGLDNVEIKDRAVELAINFDVKKSTDARYIFEVMATGFEKPVPVPADGNVLLEFCASKCQVLDPQFLLAAFSVVRFEGLDGRNPTPPPTPPPNPVTPSPTPPPTTTPPPAPPPPPVEIPECEEETAGSKWPMPGDNTGYYWCDCDLTPSGTRLCMNVMDYCILGQIFSFKDQACVWPRGPVVTTTQPSATSGPARYLI